MTERDKHGQTSQIETHTLCTHTNNQIYAYSLRFQICSNQSYSSLMNPVASYLAHRDKPLPCFHMGLHISSQITGLLRANLFSKTVPDWLSRVILVSILCFGWLSISAFGFLPPANSGSLWITTQAFQLTVYFQGLRMRYARHGRVLKKKLRSSDLSLST